MKGNIYVQRQNRSRNEQVNRTRDTYLNAAGHSEGIDPNEVRYFLPRCLDFLANGQCPAHSSFLELQRLKYVDWNDNETKILEKFAWQFLFERKYEDPLMGILDAIEMFFAAGLPIFECMTSWEISSNQMFVLDYSPLVISYSRKGSGSDFEEQLYSWSQGEKVFVHLIYKMEDMIFNYHCPDDESALNVSQAHDILTARSK